MGRRSSVRLTRRLIDSTPIPAKGQRTTLWDADVTGLALVVHPTGAKTWMLYYRTDGGQQRKPKLGAYGVLTLEQARRMGREWLAEVAQGRDPSQSKQEARSAPSMADLWEIYWKQHALLHKVESSRKKDDENWRNHIRSAMGAMKVAAVTRADVVELKTAIAKTGTGVANRCLSLLSKMFSFAERELGWRAGGTNPVKGVQRFAENRRERYLTPLEYTRLLHALDRASEKYPVETAALRLLVFTGCRVSSVLTLRWDQVRLEDPPQIFPNTKTGRKQLPLSPPAVELLRGVTRSAASPFVFAATSRSRNSEEQEHLDYGRLQRTWTKLREDAGLPGLRIHDLRHSFATMAVTCGVGLPTIGRLLGHSSPQATARYSHVPDAHSADVNNQIGTLIANLGKPAHD